MTRAEAFEGYATHSWYHRNFKKLGQADLEICRAFIRDNDQLGALEFEYAINRLFLFKAKPKNWTLIGELLMSANSAAHRRDSA